MSDRIARAVAWQREHAVWLALALIVAGLGFFHFAQSATNRNSAQAVRSSARVAQQGVQTGYELAVNNRAACLGNATRTVQQLKIDWDIYMADLQTSRTSSGAQQEIRGGEAAKILTGMERIAAVRVSVTVANQLPPVLASVVRRADFHCPSVPPKRPEGLPRRRRRLRRAPSI